MYACQTTKVVDMDQGPRMLQSIRSGCPEAPSEFSGVAKS